MLWHANKKFQEKYASKAAALPVSFLLSDAQQLTAPSAAAVPSNAVAVAPRQSAQGLLLPYWYHAHTGGLRPGVDLVWSQARACSHAFHRQPACKHRVYVSDISSMIWAACRE